MCLRMVHLTDQGITIWFWSRNDPTAPAEVRGIGGGGNLLDAVDNVLGSSLSPHVIEPSDLWGLPEAVFPISQCSASHFDAHMMIFDLTFCVSDYVQLCYTWWLTWSTGRLGWLSVAFLGMRLDFVCQLSVFTLIHDRANLLTCCCRC
jgi:hypothetical protein